MFIINNFLIVKDFFLETVSLPFKWQIMQLVTDNSPIIHFNMFTSLVATEFTPAYVVET